MNSVEFNTVNKIICKLDAAQSLAEHCQSLSITHPLLVTDAGLIKAGVVDGVIAPLKDAKLNVQVYSDVKADPTEDLVLAAVKFAQENQIDGVIGLGGGSSLDVAKLIAVLTQSEQSIHQIYGVDNILGQRLPLILLPTTAGTGSEVTPISIITTGATTKSGVVSACLLPDLTILDAALTVGLPPSITAATGIDAMVHAIEAYTSKIKKNPYSDMLAREALNLMSKNLPEAVKNGGNVEARSNMLLGSMMAGQAFANAPVAAVHALAYPLGGNYHIPHGLSNSLVLPHVLRFNASSAAHLYSELLSCVTTTAEGGDTQQRCDAFIRYIDNLISELNLPKNLQALNIPKSDLERLADEAMLQQRLLINNPREVSRDDVLAIYHAAY